MTDHTTATWVWLQLIEATPWNRKPQYLIHDCDRVWGPDLKGPHLGGRYQEPTDADSSASPQLGRGTPGEDRPP